MIWLGSIDVFIDKKTNKMTFSCLLCRNDYTTVLEAVKCCHKDKIIEGKESLYGSDKYYNKNAGNEII